MSKTQNVNQPQAAQDQDKAQKTAAAQDRPTTRLEAYRQRLAALRAAREARVRIKLPLDKNNQAPLLVTINENRYSVKRGVPVEVPIEVARTIERSIAADEKTAARIQALETEFEARGAR